MRTLKDYDKVLLHSDPIQASANEPAKEIRGICCSEYIEMCQEHWNPNGFAEELVVPNMRSTAILRMPSGMILIWWLIDLRGHEVAIRLAKLWIKNPPLSSPPLSLSQI